jgi:hypothetical protein
MSLPNSLLSYDAQLKFMEMALDEERGTRMFFKRPQDAEHWRMRCNYARVLHRRENERVHESDTLMHGKSEYDVLVFTIRTSPDGFWVYAEKQVLDTSRVEPIPVEDYAKIDASEIHLIEDHSDDDETATG